MLHKMQEYLQHRLSEQADSEVMKEVVKYKEGLKKKIVEANEELKKIKYPYKTN